MKVRLDRARDLNSKWLKLIWVGCIGRKQEGHGILTTSIGELISNNNGR